MIGYLIKRILFLALFVGAIILMPILGWLAALLFILLLAFSYFKSGIMDSSLSPGASFLFIIVSLFTLSRGLNFLSSLDERPLLAYFITVSLCCLALIAGGRIFRGFVATEERSYYIDSNVSRFTRFYPRIMIITGVFRIILEGVFALFNETLLPYLSYKDIAVKLGIFFFVASIVMYVFRMIHIFEKNR